MMEILHVSSKGQVVIPEKVREELNIQAGTKLVLIEKDGTLILKKEEEVLRHLEENEKKEEIGWMTLAEKSLQKIWDNKKDDKIWKKYL